MATTGLNFTAPSSGGWCEEHYKNGTNCSFGFKVERKSTTGKTIVITFGLRNFDAGGSTYSYGYASSSTQADNHVTINGTRKPLGAYNFTGVGNSWQATDYYVEVDLTSGGTSGSTSINISYSMEMNNSCYPGGAEGVITIPAGFIPSSEYYSNCGAPTSVSISPSIITPNGTFTVTWSGATNGTNNNITKFYVYYTLSSGGSAPTTGDYTKVVTKEVTAGTTGSNISITLSGATRGYKIVAGVVAYGAHGSSGIKTGGSCIINTLPNAPTVNPTTTYFPSGGGTVTATLTAGNTNDSGQTATLYYAINSTTNTKYSTTTSFSQSNVSSNTTYYFWTYDGLEYSSSYATLKAYSGGVPLAGAVTLQSPITGTYSNTTCYSYIGNIKYGSITRSTYANSNGSKCYLKVVIKYKARTASSSASWSSKTVINSLDLGTKTSADVGAYKLVSNIGTNQQWYLVATVTDEQGNSSDTNSDTYYTPPQPTINDPTCFINQHSNTNITNFSDYFYRNGRIYIPKDPIFTQIAATKLTIGSSTVDITPSSLTTSGSWRYFNFTITYKNEYGGQYVTVSTLTVTDGYNTVPVNIDSTALPNGLRKTMILPISFESFSSWPATYQYYSGASTSTFGIGVKALTSSNCAAYGISSLNSITLNMSYGNNNVAVTHNAWSISSSTLTCTVTKANLQSAINNLGFSNKYEKFPYILNVTATLVFGGTISKSSSSSNYYINFAESPTITELSLTCNGKSIAALAVQKGMTIDYSCTVKSYNQGNCTLSIGYALTNASAPTTNATTETQKFGENTGTGQLELTYSGTWTVPAINTAISNSDYTFKFFIRAENTLTGATSIYSTISSKRNYIVDKADKISATLSGSNIVVTFSSWSDNFTFPNISTVSYTHSYTTKVYGTNSGNPTQGTVYATVTSTSFPPSNVSFSRPSDINFLNLQAVTIRTITQVYTSSGTSSAITSTEQNINSNIFAFYADIPTISYRKNQVIINKLVNPSSDQILGINPFSAKNKIVIYSVGAVAGQEGTITCGTSNTLPSLINFNIDCGSW